MITILEKFLTELEMGVGGGGVKAITRTASAVKNFKYVRINVLFKKTLSIFTVIQNIMY